MRIESAASDASPALPLPCHYTWGHMCVQHRNTTCTTIADTLAVRDRRLWIVGFSLSLYVLCVCVCVLCIRARAPTEPLRANFCSFFSHLAIRLSVEISTNA